MCETRDFFILIWCCLCICEWLINANFIITILCFSLSSFFSLFLCIWSSQPTSSFSIFFTTPPPSLLFPLIQFVSFLIENLFLRNFSLDLLYSSLPGAFYYKTFFNFFFFFWLRPIINFSFIPSPIPKDFYPDKYVLSTLFFTFWSPFNKE